MFLTWRLHGSLPPNRNFPRATTSGRAFLAMDRLLDGAATGPRYLCRSEIASLVAEAIRYRDPEQYHLHSFVVMPNPKFLGSNSRTRLFCWSQWDFDLYYVVMYSCYTTCFCCIFAI